MRSFRLSLAVSLFVCLFPLQTVWGSECPPCAITSSSGCREWGNGKAKFIWASKPGGGSSISLSAGSCGEGGESGRAYIFTYVDTHNATCNGDAPCADEYGYGGTYAVIQVSGKQEAFQSTLGGLGFTGDKWYPDYDGGGNWSGVGVSQTGCDYILELGGARSSKIRLLASVSRCEKKFSGSRFGITVKIYEKRTREGHSDRYILLANTSGSITVKTNDSRSSKPQNFHPDMLDGSSIANNQDYTQYYTEPDGQSQWKMSYRNGVWGSCSSEEGWAGNFPFNDGVSAERETFYRVKYPGWGDSVNVNHQPDYVTQEGWFYDRDTGDYRYDMGDEGDMIYRCQNAPDGTKRLRTIERIIPGDPNDHIEWTFVYDIEDRLQYIHNGTTGDPNSITNATKYYNYDWFSGDGNDPDVTFYTRDAVGYSWQPQREWQLEFDADGRPTKYRSGCGSGCSAQSGGFEHVDYAFSSGDEDYEEGREDYIRKRYNAAEVLIEENEYEIIEFGEYVQAGWAPIPNGSFEAVDVTGCEDLTAAPLFWDGPVQTAQICDANETPENPQFLHLGENTGTDIHTILRSSPISDGRYEFSMRAREIAAGAHTTIELHAGTEPLLVVDANSLDLTGQWQTFSGIWDCGAQYEDLVYSHTPFTIYLSGSQVEIDDLQLNITKYVSDRTKPIVKKQWVYDPQTSQKQLALERKFDYTNCIITEKQYIKPDTYRLKKQVFEDKSFATLVSETVYEDENVDPDNPTGGSFTTTYGGDDPNSLFITYYPSGKKADAKQYDGSGNVIESYVIDLTTDANSLRETYKYEEFESYPNGNEEIHQWNLIKHTDARGGVTEYEYLASADDPDLYQYSLLKKQIEPETDSGRKTIQYFYNDARQVKRVLTQDSEGRSVNTYYRYNSKGLLEHQEVVGDDFHAVTSYRYNDFGQQIRQIDPDGVITGKSYGLGGELLSEFVIADSCDPNAANSNLTLVSQICYTYTADGQIELIGRYKSDSSFDYQPDLDSNPNNWIVTKHEYYPDGKQRKIIEDFGTGRTNLTTEYQYNLQGELEKVIYPTGKWVKTIRDGRGLVTEEHVGYGSSPETIVLKTVYSYDDDGNLIQQDDPDGTTTVYSYDNFGRLEKTWKKDQDGPCTVRVYNEAGEVEREYTLDSDGSMLLDIRRQYDAAGQLAGEQVVKDPNHPSGTDDQVTFYYYDIAGNLEKMLLCGISTTDPNRYLVDPNEDAITEYAYDALNRRIKTVDPEGIVSSIVYSPGGRVLEVLDPNTNDPNVLFLTTNIYDPYGRLEKSVNPMGHYTEYLYNSLNQVTKQTVFDCNETPDFADDDFAVRQMRMEYDNLGNLTKQIVMADPANAGAYQAGTDLITESVYDSSTGLLDKIRRYFSTSATAAETDYEYDGIGRKYRTTDPAGNVEEITYYSLTDGNPAQVKKTTRKEVNSENQQEFYTITTFFEYDDYGRLFKKVLDTDGDGIEYATDQTTTFHYDGLDRLTSEVDHNEVVTHYQYDGFGNMEQKIDDFGTGLTNRTTEFVYSRLNRLYQILAYDPNDTTQAVSIQTTTYDYDRSGNVTKITYPDDKYVEYEYNILNKVELETRRDGSFIYYWYDLLGNLIAESDHASGERGNGSFLTEFWYDAAGNLVYAYKEEGGVEVSESEFTYNGFGLRTSESAQYDGLLSKTTNWTYDGSGNRLTQTHGANTLTFASDGLGRIKAIDRGQDRIINTTYLGGQTYTIEYPEPNVIQAFDYDDLGRILRSRSTDVTDTSILDFHYHYDAVGNRDSVRYGHLSPQVWENYSYDGLYRLDQVAYGASSGLANASSEFESLVQAALAWVNETADYTNSTDYISKNPKNPVILSENKKMVERAAMKAGFRNFDDFLNSARAAKRYAYDPDAPILTLVELGSETKNSYRAESILDEDSNVIARIVWDDKDRMVLFAMYPDVGGTIVAGTAYDKDGNITSNLFTIYDENGNVLSQENILNDTTSYAQAEDLSSFSALSLDGGSTFMMSSTPEGPQARTDEYNYDHLGNRTTVYLNKGDMAQEMIEYDHNLVNQYSTINRSVLGLPLDGFVEYDDNGNLQTDVNGNTFTYDYRNRLVKVEDADFNTTAEYVYDALGRRISKTVDSVATYFFYDEAGQVIAEYDGDMLEREFVYGNGYNEVLAMFNPYHAGDPDDFDAFIEFCDAWLADVNDPNSSSRYDSSYDHDSDGTINCDDFAYFASVWDIPSGRESNWYYLRDALGSIRGLVGGRFNREEDREFYNYDVYGKLSIQTPEKSKFDNPYLFAGYRFDPETELYQTPNRIYDPTTGRWLQFDPILYADSWNQYEYVIGNPTRFSDPLGLLLDPNTRILAAYKSGALTYKEVIAILGLAAAMQLGIEAPPIPAPSLPRLPDIGKGREPKQPSPQEPKPPLVPPVCLECKRDSKPSGQEEPKPSHDPQCKKPKPNTGDCTLEEWAPLRDAQDKACKGIPHCTENMSQQELWENAHRFNNCMRARHNLMKQCFRGGDEGHWDQIMNMQRGRGKCIEILNRKRWNDDGKPPVPKKWPDMHRPDIYRWPPTNL